MNAIVPFAENFYLLLGITVASAADTGDPKKKTLFSDLMATHACEIMVSRMYVKL